MAIEDEEIKKITDTGKEVLFKSIDELTSAQVEMIKAAKRVESCANVDGNLPNIGNTIHNKIESISNQFENAGISMFASRIEGYGENRESKVVTPLIGSAILSDLTSMIQESGESLSNFSQELGKYEEKFTKNSSLKPINQISRFFSKIRQFFMPNFKPKNPYEQEEMNMNKCLQEYRDINKKAWQYNLRDNMPEGLAKKIKEKGFSIQALPEVVRVLVLPDLEKLGMTDLLPQIDQKLKEEYERDIINDKIKQALKENMQNEGQVKSEEENDIGDKARE